MHNGIVEIQFGHQIELAHPPTLLEIILHSTNINSVSDLLL